MTNGESWCNCVGVLPKIISTWHLTIIIMIITLIIITTHHVKECPPLWDRQ